MNKDNAKIIWSNILSIMDKIPTPGVLMLCGNDKIKENLITLGWIQFGVIWNEVVVSILVRPSRFSFELLKRHNEFSLNIMPEGFNKQIQFCGEKSGRYVDKFFETKLKKCKSNMISTSSLKDADITLECKILHKNFINPENLSDLVLAKFYGGSDYHQIITASIEYFKTNLEWSVL